MRDCLARWDDDGTSDAFLVHVHLAIALVLQAYHSVDAATRTALLDEARERVEEVAESCRRLGLSPDHGAACLVRGMISVMSPDDRAASWFANGIAAAGRGRQMETLWRSHINYATAVDRAGGAGRRMAAGHAWSAVEIMEQTLAGYSQPDRSARFDLVGIGLANAASILMRAGDDRGLGILQRYPRLRQSFVDVDSGELVQHDGRDRHYQWLHLAGADYVLY